MTENKERPSREQMIQWYKEEIELATLRMELAKLQRDATVYEAERLNAIGAIAQMTQSDEEAAAPDKKPRTLKKEAVDAD